MNSFKRLLTENLHAVPKNKSHYAPKFDQTTMPSTDA